VGERKNRTVKNPPTRGPDHNSQRPQGMATVKNSEIIKYICRKSAAGAEEGCLRWTIRTRLLGNGKISGVRGLLAEQGMGSACARGPSRAKCSWDHQGGKSA